MVQKKTRDNARETLNSTKIMNDWGFVFTKDKEDWKLMKCEIDPSTQLAVRFLL